MVYKKSLIVLGCLAVLLIGFINCSTKKQEADDPRGSAYSGSASCIPCHADVMDYYKHNSHYKTSSIASSTNLEKLINPSSISIVFKNDQKVNINKRDSAFYQSYIQNNQLIRSEKMDIVFGSGKDAQTFGYWKDNQLYELPLTHLTSIDTWTNSPGFPLDHPYFTRIIPSRCFECHTSYVHTTEERDGNLLQIKQIFDKASIVYGIDCERCHGPAAQHVKFQQENPGIKEAKFITTIKTLSGQQQLDMCGTCHAGNPVSMKSIFGFTPGDTLAKFYLFYNNSSIEPDVHGNQLPLLQLSKCFQQSKMTCITCHDPHQSEENMPALINKCMTCHEQTIHPASVKIENNNCITCHMPARSSRSLDFNDEIKSNNLQYLLRTHRIAIYPQEEWK